MRTTLVQLSDLDLGLAASAMRAKPDQNVLGQPIRMRGVTFDRGVGVHGPSCVIVDLGCKCVRFSATVGVDDDQLGVRFASPVEFRVYVDGVLVWSSGPMHAGDEPREVAVAVADRTLLTLKVVALAGNTVGAIANWAQAVLQVQEGYAPQVIGDLKNHQVLPGEVTVAPATAGGRFEVRTPPPNRLPRINGPTVFGVRPGSPFFYSIPVVGARPLTFTAESVEVDQVSGAGRGNLLPGLQFDAGNGRLSGRFDRPGQYRIRLGARNAHGQTSAELTIVVGDAICLTPPLGWNSWNSWGAAVDEAKVREAAARMVSTGLADHGWLYVNIDDGWQGRRDASTRALMPNHKFPDMASLVEYIHALGLRAGIYSTPWACSCMHFAGGSADTPEGEVLDDRLDFGVYPFHEQDSAQFARWGIDFLKYDWSPDLPHTKAMSDALRTCGRDIVFSLSASTRLTRVANWPRLANLWRTSEDITDTWPSIFGRSFRHYRWRPFQGPGHWNDPDMLVVGWLSWGKAPHACRLTPAEQYTHISLWTLFAAPMLLGCDLARLDDFTLGLLTNDEILAIHQDPLGCQAWPVVADPAGRHVLAKPLADGSLAVGLFNTADHDLPVGFALAEVGFTGTAEARDVWRQKDMGTVRDRFSAELAPHDALVLRLVP